LPDALFDEKNELSGIEEGFEGEDTPERGNGHALNGEASNVATAHGQPAGRWCSLRKFCTPLGAELAVACRAMVVFLQQVLVPPVVGVLLALLCGFSGVRPLLIDVDRDAGTVTPGTHLGWLWNGIVRLGSPAIPISLLLAGVSLSKGPNWKVIEPRTNLCIAVAKLVVFPVFGASCVFILSRSGLLSGITAPWREPFYLVALIMSSTPSAQQLLTMNELSSHGCDRAVLGSIIFLQWLLVPVILTLSVSIAVILTALL